MSIPQVGVAVKFGNGLQGNLSGESKQGAVLVSHGAGGTKDTPLLVQTCQQLNKKGFLTLRWNFGYVERRSAPSAGGKKETPEMETAFAFLKSHAGGVPVILLGKSFGARVSTFFATERNDIDGFVFYGLPLHSVSKNAKPRDWSHLAKLHGKILFVTGDKDKLCGLDHLAEVQKMITAPYESHIVPGDHSFKLRGEQQAISLCMSWFDKTFPRTK
jgi:predicted alpha/beta-hydrolase family hydrolase